MKEKARTLILTKVERKSINCSISMSMLPLVFPSKEPWTIYEVEICFKATKVSLLMESESQSAGKLIDEENHKVQKQLFHKS